MDAEREYQFWVAKLAKIAERERRQRAHWESIQEKQLAQVTLSEYQAAIRRIRELGGIRPYRNGHACEEWQGLPRSVKRRSGLAADEVAFRIGEEFPWLGIECDTDLAAYLSKHRR